MARKRDLDIQRSLLRLEEARAAAQKASLQEAERLRLECENEVVKSEARTLDAFDNWEASIGSNALGPSYLLAAADRLLAAESGLAGARKQLEASSREAEDQASRYRLAEARRSGSAKRLSRQQRIYSEARNERNQEQVQEILLSRKGRS